MTARISLTMIVKNEAATLSRCLASVRDLVHEIIVVDTGSSDNTKDIARRYGACVFDLPWPDSFAAARNESIRRATGQWLLWLDADEYFDETNRAKLRALLANLKDDNTAYVMGQCSQEANGFVNIVDQVRLFRNHPTIHWDYHVHEQILPSLREAGHAVRPTELVIDHSGYLDPTLRRAKMERNLRLLHLDLADRPNDPFMLFRIGSTLAGLDRFGEAIPLLQRGLQHSQPAHSITPPLYALLTRCHRFLGQLSEAWAVCQAGYVHYPNDTELMFLKEVLRGQLCHQRGDHAAARRCWTQLLEDRSPIGTAPTANGIFRRVDSGLREPMVRHLLALLDRDEGQFTNAEKHWRTILTDKPSFTAARVSLAELYLQQSRWAELEKLLAELTLHAPLVAAALRVRMNQARQELVAALPDPVAGEQVVHLNSPRDADLTFTMIVDAGVSEGGLLVR